MSDYKEAVNRTLVEAMEWRSLETLESTFTEFNDPNHDSNTLHSSINNLRETAMASGYVDSSVKGVVEMQEKIQKVCDNIHSTLLETASLQRGDEWRFKAKVLKELSYVVGVLEYISESMLRRE